MSIDIQSSIKERNSISFLCEVEDMDILGLLQIPLNETSQDELKPPFGPILQTKTQHHKPYH